MAGQLWPQDTDRSHWGLVNRSRGLGESDVFQRSHWPQGESKWTESEEQGHGCLQPMSMEERGVVGSERHGKGREEKKEAVTEGCRLGAARIIHW